MEPAANPPEALFYHLVSRPLEHVLPELLEKSLARGWRVVARIGSPERLAALNGFLWTWRDDSFLPHGGSDDGFPERQPIYLTCGSETPNAAQVQFLLDGASGDLLAFPRSVVMFDARDQAAVETARAAWRSLKGASVKATYWRQNEHGRWEKHAEQ